MHVADEFLMAAVALGGLRMIALTLGATAPGVPWISTSQRTIDLLNPQHHSPGLPYNDYESTAGYSGYSLSKSHSLFSKIIKKIKQKRLIIFQNHIGISSETRNYFFFTR